MAVPWRSLSDQEKLSKTGAAKLLIGASVSGGKVLSVYNIALDIPESFKRSLDREQEVGRGLSTVFSIVYFLILIGAVFYVVRSRDHILAVASRQFFFKLGLFLFGILCLGALNLSQGWLMNYPTSQSYSGFLARFGVQTVISIAFFTAGFVLIVLGGEILRQRDGQVFKRSSFLYYIRSSFFSREVSHQVFMGYMAVAVLLGAQAVIFALGQKYFHVWSEESWLMQFSGAYIPALAAVVIGLKASLTEEASYRLFSFFWLKSITKNVLVSALIASLIWGFSHSAYLIFPMWFRGVEVTFLGFGFIYVYLRFGLLAVLVAHYLFDVFWAGAGCLFGAVYPLYFWSAIAVLALPAGWALAAYLMDRSDEEHALIFSLGPAQQFNSAVMKAYVQQRLNAGADREQLKDEFLKNNWDPVVVARVFEE